MKLEWACSRCGKGGVVRLSKIADMEDITRKLLEAHHRGSKDCHQLFRIEKVRVRIPVFSEIEWDAVQTASEE
jgi:hypothetical protein